VLAHSRERYNAAQPHKALNWQAPTFCKADLELALRLAVQSQNICEEEERWRVFRQRPFVLSLLIAHALENANLSDGDPLFRSDLIESDS